MTRTIRSIAANSLALAACLVCPPLVTHGAEFTVKTVDKEAPKALSDSIRSVLQAKAVQLLEGDKPIYEFWFRKEIPLKSKPQSETKGLAAIAETTFCGVVSVEKDERDYKDNEIPHGLYTVRFGLQPQDGDHLGTAEYPYFLVLIAAQNDPELHGIAAYKPMVKASGKTTPSGHPMVLSLRPPTSASGEFPALNEPAPEHRSIHLKVPAKAPGADQPTSVVFELVYQGKGKI